MGKEKRNKCCTKCGEDSWQPNGVGNWRCSPCLVKQRRNRYLDRKEEINAKNLEWAIANPEATRKIKKRWVDNNPEKQRAIAKNCRDKRPDHYRAYVSARRKRVKTATPSWVGELESLIINEIYVHSLDLKRTTGIEYHVDHIIPLNGLSVCGLHVPDNLQIIPARLNMEKGNDYEAN